MARAFSLASWNVEHFTDGDPVRTDRVAEFLASKLPGGRRPDVFAVLEVRSRDVYKAFMEKFPDHRFHQSEGKQMQEMLIGVHKDLPSFVTQRISFKLNNDHLRPGVLVSFVAHGKTYTVLFLHAKSGPDPYSLGMRFEAIENCFGLGKALDGAAEGAANYLFVGDLNTMGAYSFPYLYPTSRRITAEEEIERLRRTASGRGMKLLDKDAANTYQSSSGSLTGDLDHVVATKHLDFKSWGTDDAKVTVLGWPKEDAGQDQLDWIETHSDHGVLYLEVQKS